MGFSVRIGTHFTLSLPSVARKNPLSGCKLGLLAASRSYDSLPDFIRTPMVAEGEDGFTPGENCAACRRGRASSRADRALHE